MIGREGEEGSEGKGVAENGADVSGKEFGRGEAAAVEELGVGGG